MGDVFIDPFNPGGINVEGGDISVSPQATEEITETPGPSILGLKTSVTVSISIGI